MHSTQDIERRLRLPAPDEPAILPALVLPQADPGSGVVRGRVRAGSSGATVGFGSLRLVFVLLLLAAAVVGALVTGALRLDRRAITSDASFAGRGLTLTIPDGWVRLTPDDPLGASTAATALVASSTEVEGCSAADIPVVTPAAPVMSGSNGEQPMPSGKQYQGYEDQIFECALTEPMAPGELRLALSMGPPQIVGVGPMETFDATAWFGPDAEFGDAAFYVPTEADGWVSTIDGLPAKVVVVPGRGGDGPDEVRTWGVHDPRYLGTVWYVRMALRGPDLGALRQQADRIAASLRFTEKPIALDEAQRDEKVREAIDRLDREFREFRGTRMFGCFPRTAGEQTVELEHGPGGPLLEPFTATCRTMVETTPLMRWRAVLSVEWAAADGRDAGRWGWELFVGQEPANSGQGELPGNVDADFPGTGGELPPPLAEPLVIPAGAIVEVLPPGIDQATIGGPIQDLYQDPNGTIGDRIVHDAQPGRRFSVVDGPLTHRGTDWYLVETVQGTAFPGEFQWAPATDDDRPLLAVVEPDCPETPSFEDLLTLIPAERVACFGDDELTLEPTYAQRSEHGQGGSVTGTPPWLAGAGEWQLFGAGGPAGVEGGITVALAPAAGEELPTGVALRVRGHFDDVAGATCERTFPDGWGGMAETAEMQHIRCRETFVVTSVEESAAP